MRSIKLPDQVIVAVGPWMSSLHIVKLRTGEYIVVKIPLSATPRDVLDTLNASAPDEDVLFCIRYCKPSSKTRDEYPGVLGPEDGRILGLDEPLQAQGVQNGDWFLAGFLTSERRGPRYGGANMIKYSETRRGDILRVVAPAAPGYAKAGDLVRVVEVYANGVVVEDKGGFRAEFVFGCGANRLEPTEWRNDFPVETPENKA